MSKPLLSLKNINKRFGITVALDDVSLNVYPGEVRGLIGENGSGKSTISSIAAGMLKADSGQMEFLGKKWKPESMIDALSGGIGMIVQESGTITGISVAENIFLAEFEQFRSGLGFVNRRAMNKEAQKVLSDIGIDNVSASAPMQSLDFQARKLVEIAKVVMKQPQILVIDETSTALSHDGREILYDVIKKFRKSGRAVIFISHDLDEIMDICDTLSVLRDGKMIRDFEKSEFEADAIRTSMIGRELEGDYYRSDYSPTSRNEVSLKIENISFDGVLENVSLNLHKGEIVGIGGLAHCGMHTLGKVAFGAESPDSGTVTVEDETTITSPEIAMKKGIGYVSKDRDTESLCLSASIKDNISVAGLSKFAVGNFLILGKNERKYVKEQIESLSVKCSDMNQDVSDLSGGNKQKVVFGKWIGCGSEILILDCPTRGVDIGVKQAMYQLMSRLKDEGKSILMISEELSELIGMSDRIIIMKNGKITKQFKRSAELTDAKIIKYMI